jgi:hypothetical protein
VKRRGTWLVVVAVAGLGLVATVDAVRDEEEAAPPAPKAQKPGPGASEEMRVAGMLLRDQAIRGTLTYTDQDCVLRAVALPDLEARDPMPSSTVSPASPICRITVTRGPSFSIGGDVPSPRGDLSASCTAGRVGVRAASTGNPFARVRGCSPAWKPDETLTVIRKGALVEIEITPTDALRASRIVLSPADLRRALAGDPWRFRDPVLREVAWMDNSLVAAIVRERGRNDHVFALFRGTRLVAAPPFPYPRLVDLRVSPFGGYVAARFAGGQGLIVLDERGDLVSAGIRTAHAITWSPDEIWTALATNDGVFVFPTGERAIQLIRVPIAARDLVWR